MLILRIMAVNSTLEFCDGVELTALFLGVEEIGMSYFAHTEQAPI